MLSPFDPSSKSPTPLSAFPENSPFYKTLISYVPVPPQTEALVISLPDGSNSLWRVSTLATADETMSEMAALIDDTFHESEPFLRSCADLAVLEAMPLLTAGSMFYDYPVFKLTNNTVRQLIYVIFVGLVDGNFDRLQHLRSAWLESITTLANEMIHRATALVMRASTVSKGIEAVDLRIKTRVHGCVAFEPSQTFVLRPSFAYALTSVLLACPGLWCSLQGTEVIPAALYAFAHLSTVTRQRIYLPGTIAHQGEHQSGGARLALQPDLDGFAVTRRVVYALAFYIQIHSSKHLRNGEAMLGMMSRLVLCNEPAVHEIVRRHLLSADKEDRQLMGNRAFTRILLSAQFYTPHLTSTSESIVIESAMHESLHAQLRRASFRYGRHIPLTLLLSCVPFPLPISPGMAVPALPPVSFKDVRLRCADMTLPCSNPRVLFNSEEIAKANGHTVDDRRPEVIDIERCWATALRESARSGASPVSLLYEVGMQYHSEAVNWFIALRLLGAISGHTIWNDPSNFLVSRNRVLVDGASAHAAMLMGLRMRLYTEIPEFVPRYFPYASPVYFRELCFILRMTNVANREELAAVFCDTLHSMLCLANPMRPMVKGTSLAVAGFHTPRVADWPSSVCIEFIFPFLSSVLSRHLSHGYIQHSPTLYDGRLHALRIMLSPPHRLNEEIDAGIIRWPVAVITALARFGFVLNACFHQNDDVDIAPIFRLNGAMIQAWAFLYIYLHLDKDDLNEIVGRTCEVRSYKHRASEGGRYEGVMAFRRLVPCTRAVEAYLLDKYPIRSLSDEIQTMTTFLAPIAVGKDIEDTAVVPLSQFFEKANGKNGIRVIHRAAMIVASSGSTAPDLIAVVQQMELSAKDKGKRGRSAGGDDERPRPIYPITPAEEKVFLHWACPKHKQRNKADDNAHRRERRHQLAVLYDRLARFMLFALVNSVGNGTSAIFAPLMCGVVGTVRCPEAVSAATRTWLKSPVQAYNHKPAVEKIMQRAYDYIQANRLPGMYPSSTLPSAGLQGWDRALRELFLLELTPFVSRSFILDRSQSLCNQVYGVARMASMLGYDLPVFDSTHLTRENQPSVFFSYDLKLGVRDNHVQGVAEPIAELKSGGPPPPASLVPYRMESARWFSQVQITLPEKRKAELGAISTIYANMSTFMQV